MKAAKFNEIYATDMGHDQAELANWVLDKLESNGIIDQLNKSGQLFVDEDDNLTDESVNYVSIIVNTDNLVHDACEDLKWHSVPQVGGLVMTFTAI